jgi:hypothetical protein
MDDVVPLGRENRPDKLRAVPGGVAHPPAVPLPPPLKVPDGPVAPAGHGPPRRPQRKRAVLLWLPPLILILVIALAWTLTIKVTP